MRRTPFLVIVVAGWAISLSGISAEDKPPPPSKDAQQEALSAVKDVFGEEWAAAKTDAQRQALATELLKTAAGTTEPADRYVLMRVARDVATQGGDGATAFQAIDEMVRFFRVDAVRLKASVLHSLSQRARLRADHKSIAEQSLILVAAAVAKDDFDTAGKLVEMGLAEARQAGHTELLKRVVARKAEFADFTAACKEAKAAAEILESSPTDADANRVVGEYRCCFKGDWNGGLPMLALGNDPGLKSLAVAELNEAPNADQSLALADGWWDRAQDAAEGPIKNAQIRRAGLWYGRAKAAGVGGLARAKAEKRLKAIAELGLPKLSESVAANLPSRPTVPSPQPVETRRRPADQPIDPTGLWMPQEGAVLGSDGYWKLEHKGQEKLVLTRPLETPWELNFVFNPRVERAGIIVRLLLPGGEDDELVVMTQAKFTSNLYLKSKGSSNKVRQSHSHATQNGRPSRARIAVTNGEFKFWVNDRLNFEWQDPRVVPPMGIIISGYKLKVRDITLSAAK